MSDNDDYEVGYGRPPENTRFKKGVSGNPKGRPKDHRDFNADLDEILKAKVTITEKGRPKKVSTQRAALLRLTEKALRGDPRTLEKLLEISMQRSDERQSEAAGRKLTSDDTEILQRYAAALAVRQECPGSVENHTEDDDDEQ